MAIESMFFSSGSPSGLIRNQVRPWSRERKTPSRVPATSVPGSEGATDSAFTGWPAIPSSSSNVSPPSRLRATPPPAPCTSQ